MKPPKNRILVVDDDMRLRDLLLRYLNEQGFTVDAAHDAASMDRMLAAKSYEIIVLDLMLPGEDGLSICRRLRAAKSDVPIIMLTAKGDDVERIIGLEMGADDYLPKPFNPRELVARIQAVLRRRAPQPPAGAPSDAEGTIPFGSFVLNLATRRLVNGTNEIALTTGEFSLLKILATHPREPLSRDKLMQLARGRDHEAFDRSIDVQVSRLRKIIEPDPANPIHIQTVWGFGYVFVPDDKSA